MPNPYQGQINQAWATALQSCSYAAGTLATYNSACAAFAPLNVACLAAAATYHAHQTQVNWNAWHTAYYTAETSYLKAVSDYETSMGWYNTASQDCTNAMNLYNAHLEDTPPPAEPDPGPLPPAPNGIVLPPLPPSGPVGPG